MDIEQAYQVANYLGREHDSDIEVREGYSGRGMYGAEVPAFIVRDNQDVVLVGVAFRALGFDADDAPRRSDSMGLRYVLY